ncbi:MAG TPA: NAD-dependent epimerase/dehydratase family protein [Amycolatopsis sp.]|nr:NAD-dependent epimerase/dehydratase family protein [Amycolatopsis sp.]
MRALVTGASGFIGSHLVRRLERSGIEVHAVSRNPPRDADTAARWHLADVTDASAVAGLVPHTRPDVIFHLASRVSGERSLELVSPTLRANFVSALNILTSASAAREVKVVLAGSAEEPRVIDPGQAPSSPYAAAKAAASTYALMFNQLWGVPATVLRVAMAYGPGQRDSTKLVPYAVQSLLRGESPLLTSGGRQVDWVYVDDVVDAFLAVVRSDEAQGELLDIGSGVTRSVRDTMELLTEVSGTGIHPRYGAVPDRLLDRPNVADITRATEVLEWRPKVPLREGLHRTFQWYAQQLHRASHNS